MKNANIILIFLFLALTSCHTPRAYFTKEIKTELEKQAISISDIQFYIDSDVELRRELSSGNAAVSSGKVIFENGKYINLILIKKDTPGLCISKNKPVIDISFEEGEGKYLGFEESEEQTTTYYVLASTTEPNPHYLKILHTVDYEGQKYTIENGRFAKLMINKSIIQKLKITKRVLKGRKLTKN